MTKRPAFRINLNDIHDIYSVERTIQRYGAITPETQKELTEILEKHKDIYNYRIFLEGIGQFVNLEPATHHITFECWRKGNCISKFIDNEYDAKQTIVNFKNRPPK